MLLEVLVKFCLIYLLQFNVVQSIPLLPSSFLKDQIDAESVKTSYDDIGEKYLLPEDFLLAADLPVEQPSDKELNDLQNPSLFEGDIEGIPYPMRLRDQPLNDYANIFEFPLNSAINLNTYPERLWPNGRIPYLLEKGLTGEQRAAIAQAFDEYKQKTCIRFVPKESNDLDYIYIRRNRAMGCSSYVGRSGGNQTVSLEVNKCFKKGVIAHELMHSIGFFHEHSRTDRDDYVLIEEENIRPGMMRNFEKYPQKVIDPLEMPYDYGSVMHYHKLAFSKNGKATIMPKEKNAEIGQRLKLSPIDTKKINKLYECEDELPQLMTSPPESTSTPKMTTRKIVSTIRPPRIHWTKWPKDKWSTLKTVVFSTSSPTTTTKLRRIITKIGIRPETAGKVCEDLNAHCKIWEELGHCTHSAKYMSHYCRKSCGLCGENGDNNKPHHLIVESTDECLDHNLFCSYWAKIGECESDSRYMKLYCKRSCGKCLRRLG